MANEATVTANLKVVKGKLQYQSQPTSYQADISVANGPSPGAVTVTTGAGVDINLSQLATPALTRVANLDSTNFVSIGLKIGGTYYPFMELKPGESQVIRLSRTVLAAATVHAVANVASCVILFDSFDS
ncbi:hypothetical protein [Schlesneria paludicola]|uniref:hypothetical protein n=1 Tax=Schlesneria paludicola TaxID=360056 RepID=UPI000299E966|nr:hypothetical protein [Schlesneria paludicola]